MEKRDLDERDEYIIRGGGGERQEKSVEKGSGS